MKQRVIVFTLMVGMLLSYNTFAQIGNKTKCPPAKAFFKNKQTKKVSIKTPELPKIKAPKLLKVKLPNIASIKLPKLRKPQMPSFEFLKPDGKQAASTKCPK